jgi:Rad3-related DNA helicase
MKNIQVTKELEEELIEAASIGMNFTDDVEEILKLINENEAKDHDNDISRAEAMSFLLKALEAFSSKNYADADSNVHAAIQRLQDQALQDLKDDEPRCKAKEKILITQNNAIHNEEKLRKLIGKLTGKPITNKEPELARA